MKYTIMEFDEGIGSQIKDKENKPYLFNNIKEANIDRISLQPDFNNLLKVVLYVEEEYSNDI